MYIVLYLYVSIFRREEQPALIGQLSILLIERPQGEAASSW